MDLNGTSNTIWQARREGAFSFFCPLCSTERHARMRPDPYQPILVFRVVMTAAFVALLLAPWLGWKGVVVFLPLWTGYEILYRLRARQEIECPRCGFDPYLYLADRERANARVKAHFKKRYEEAGVAEPVPRSVAAPRAKPASATRSEITSPEVGKN